MRGFSEARSGARSTNEANVGPAPLQPTMRMLRGAMLNRVKGKRKRLGARVGRRKKTGKLRPSKEKTGSP